MTLDTVTVIRQDFENARLISTTFSQEDREYHATMWHDGDRLLDDLQTVDLFKGCTRWCDLKPIHYRHLMMRSVEHTVGLRLDELSDGANPYVRSLNFVTLGFLRSLEEASGMQIELMRIHRTGPNEVSYVITSSISPALASLVTDQQPEQPKTPNFRIVVDNDKDS